MISTTCSRTKMANRNNILFFIFMFLLTVHVCTSDEDIEEVDDDKKDAKKSLDDFLGEPFKGLFKDSAEKDTKKSLLDDVIGEPLKGMGDFFKKGADAADSGMESLKGFSAGVKESSEAGAEMAKGFAEGIGSSFGKAKDKLVETGEKMKEAVGDAALNTKEEFETAATKLSKHAKDASDVMMKMFSLG